MFQSRIQFKEYVVDIVELIYLTMFYLISPFMDPDMKEMWASFSV